MSWALFGTCVIDAFHSDEAIMLFAQVVAFSVENKRINGYLHLDSRHQRKEITDAFSYLNACDRQWVIEQITDLRLA
jgi:hypothetical protein